MSRIAIEADRLRRTAEAGPIGKRHSSADLYRLLAECMALAEQCRDLAGHEEMRRLVVERGRDGGKRCYVEHGSDEYILVCRFVFDNLRSKSAERSNASRYAHAMRQAAALGVTSATLFERLSADGGINALFLRRPLDADLGDHLRAIRDVIAHVANNIAVSVVYLSVLVAAPRQRGAEHIQPVDELLRHPNVANAQIGLCVVA